ncbi:formimidoylglutamate deiminase [Tabrizicola sp.]|uniref:formimidoylglutamate deiminase n=1 Tax=Tabrizicola sp. TaxID=2005166 RepID=UPI002869F852|nr:formimidoylglutamate deiminase [Tabrizicola sp.]
MILHARSALLPQGWAKEVRIVVEGGRIAEVTVNAPASGAVHDCLLPAPVNLHSHCFQRAMAGLTEARSAGQDSFWTWRTLMYRFLEHLTPEDVEAIAALAMVEMAEAGFAGVAEFHYLHHRPGGAAYADPAEMAQRIVAAAADTGLGLTLLPVLYEQGGCDGRALQGGQLRFGCDLGRFEALLARASRGLAADGRLGVAPHSLRAVSRASLAQVAGLVPDGPVHMHLAEQVAEVTEVQAAYGARPVDWALANLPLDARWCLIHVTQMDPGETAGLAQTGAVAGLCPITEANLGDGIFDATGWQAAGGRFGVGSDSNVQITLRGELQMLEYSQRLKLRGRAVLADAGRSTGRVLLDAVCAGGAQAAGRQAGAIAVGGWADLMALETGSVGLQGLRGDTLLDAWIFAGGGGVSDLWSAGRHIVQGGRHRARAAVEARYGRCLQGLRARL